MAGLTVLGLCPCKIKHSLTVPDQAQSWTQKDAQRVVCEVCQTTVENLKLLEPGIHARSKAAS